MTKNNNNFHSDINDLIKDLDGPDYITDAFKDIGLPSLIVLSSVFRVDKSYLGSYLGGILKNKKKLILNKKILDLGCGCGFLGLICALSGASRVHFSDINPIAVINSKLNTILLNIDNVSFSTGDLFLNIPIKDKFDIIIFNPPSISGTPANHSESAFIRADNVMLKFYNIFSKYLKKNGVVIMPGSSRFDGNFSPLKIVKEYNLKYKILSKEYEKDDHYKYVILIKKSS